MDGVEDDVTTLAELVSMDLILMFSVTLFQQIQKGVSGARSDDTKSLKGAILDWIPPLKQPLNPPLSRNVKIDRGFHHERTGSLLCPTGMDWSDTMCGWHSSPLPCMLIDL